MPSFPLPLYKMDIDIIALCDSREMEGVDHVQESTGKGKHINGLFENPPLRNVMVRSVCERGIEGNNS